MNEPTITLTTSHGLSVGDVITVDISRPRPPWWRPIALYRWWRAPMREMRTFAVVASGQVEVTSLADEQPRFTDGLHLERRA